MLYDVTVNALFWLGVIGQNFISIRIKKIKIIPAHIAVWSDVELTV